MSKHTYSAIDLSDLVPKYIPEDVYDSFGDTSKVSFGDAYATLIDAEHLSDILNSDFEVPFVIQDFEAEFGKDTLIDLGS